MARVSSLRGRRPQGRRLRQPSLAALAALTVAAGAVAAALAHAAVGFAGLSSQVAGTPPRRSVTSSATAEAEPLVKFPTANSKKRMAMLTEVNPKLKLLYQTEEYGQIVEILMKLEEKGQLESFLQRASNYWKGANIADWAVKEAAAGRQLLTVLKRDWPSIWPEGMDEDRMKAFDVVGKFWKRLDASRVFDLIVDDLLPSLGGRGGASADARDERLLLMRDEDRIDVFLDRMDDSKLFNQMRELTSEDGDEVKAVGEKLKPFTCQVIADFHEKVSTQKEAELPVGITIGVSVLSIIAMLVLLFGGGVLKNPFDDDGSTPLSRTAPLYNMLDPIEQAKRQEYAEQKAELAIKAIEEDTARRVAAAEAAASGVPLPAPAVPAPSAYE